ncbi:hypothetical protein QBC35DRAFT_208640 [Podospora australis]|uniref:Uncharacterized protein n=1 Tax=Podospora australis TaxID=1536484 RepID=A0AAN7AH06_9PEZI|nr:hypothetical protein QBC35DRAFT_208640 [Podospora australis]
MKFITLLLTVLPLALAIPTPIPSDSTETAFEADTTSASDTTTTGGKTPNAQTAANYGSPKCRSAGLYDLCTSGNAGAYCDATGFHCNFMAQCAKNCWCE